MDRINQINADKAAFIFITISFFHMVLDSLRSYEDDRRMYEAAAARKSSYSAEDDTTGVVDVVDEAAQTNSVFQFLSSYWWQTFVVAITVAFATYKLLPVYRRWRNPESEYHIDPEKERAHRESMQRAREKQQKLLEEAVKQKAEEKIRLRAKQKQEEWLKYKMYGAIPTRKPSDFGPSTCRPPNQWSSSSYQGEAATVSW